MYLIFDLGLETSEERKSMRLRSNGHSINCDQRFDDNIVYKVVQMIFIYDNNQDDFEGNHGAYR